MLCPVAGFVETRMRRLSFPEQPVSHGTSYIVYKRFSRNQLQPEHFPFARTIAKIGSSEMVLE